MPEEINQKIEISKEIPISPEREKEIGRDVKPAEKPEFFEEKETVEPDVQKEIPEEIKEIKSFDQKNQIKKLCELALQKGPDYAIKMARSLNNAYVLDEFHKTLTTDGFREQLMQKG